MLKSITNIRITEKNFSKKILYNQSELKNFKILYQIFSDLSIPVNGAENKIYFGFILQI